MPDLSYLMGFQPVLAKARISHKRHTQGEGFLHLFDDDGFHLFFFFRIDREVEFVVYLKDHLTLDTLSLETLVDMNHRHLDDIRCSALNWGIDGVTLCETPHGGIVGVDIWQITTTSE